MSLNFSEAKAIDRNYIWHPYASVTAPPPVQFAVSALGNKITLDDGNILIDAVSSWWCMAHGHRHPALMEALRKQAEKIDNVMFAGFTHAPAAELTKRLLEIVPDKIERFFYADSGSVAVECATKMAIQYHSALGHPERCKLIALRGGYVGDTIGTMGLSDPDGMHLLFQGVMPKHFFAPRPNSRFDGTWDETDFEGLEACYEKHKKEVAAIIVEPIFQGGNGMWFYHPEYLRKLRSFCTKNHILMICDEIASGFGHTGKIFACEHADISPDIMTMGKVLTGGVLPMSIAASTAEVADVICSGKAGAFMHGPTYMANPLACAVACASVKLIQDPQCLVNIHRIESELKVHLEKYRHHENVKDVRCLGTIGVLELKKEPSREVIQKIVLETGVWLRPFSGHLYTMPPYITTSSEIKQITEAMGSIADAGLR
ncbi:MAG: adenosylmethionine--8-amino-7-oxononanoate transaminase [Lentisphaeria bacterium]